MTRMRDRALGWPPSTGTRRCAAAPTGSPACRSRSASRRRCGPRNSTGTWTGSGRAAAAGRSPSSAAPWARWSSGATGPWTCWTAFAGQARAGRPRRCRGSPPGTGWPSSSGCSPRSRPPPARSATRSTSCSGRRSASCASRSRPGTVGSITMPHKRNPEISEHLVTLSRVDPGPGRARPGGDGGRARAGRPGLEDRVAGWCRRPAMAFAACVGSGRQDARRAAGRPGRMLGQHRQPPRLPAVRAGDARAGRPARQALRARQRVRRRHARHRPGSGLPHRAARRPPAGRDSRRRTR